LIWYLVTEMSETEFHDFRDLEVWKKCKKLRDELWGICKTFPKDEKYRLADQIIRASRSATACIAEGNGRFHYQENIQFCRQARGSLTEIIDHLDVSLQCEYIDSTVFDEYVEKIKRAIWVLNGYIAYLKKQKQKE
jgi:four helix bundle protein